MTNIHFKYNTHGFIRYFSVLVARTAQKSTNSRKEIDCPKCKQIIDYLFSPLRTHDEIRRIQAIILKDIRRLQKSIADKRKEEKRPEYEFGRAVQCERCTRLISAIFGKDKSFESGKLSRRKALVVEDNKLLSTTAKQTEEQLAQKAELLEETPLVEAEKPKVTGFNTPPRVLGQKVDDICHTPDGTNTTGTVVRKKLRHNIEKMVRRLESAEILNKMTPIKYGVVNCASVSSDQGGKSGDSSGGDIQNTYDSIAKRFLGIPNSQIDASLIAEMKRLGIPTGSLGENSSIKVHKSKKSQKPSEKIELEARKCKDESPSASNDEISAEKVGIRQFETTSKPEAVAILHAEGIRFTEETTATEQKHVAYPSYHTIENKYKPPAQKSTDLELHKLYSPDSSTFPCHLSPFTTTHSYYYDPSIGRQPSNNSSVRHETYSFPYADKPLYDPHKPIISFETRKKINFDSELYGDSQLKNATLHNKENEIKADQYHITETYIDKTPKNIYNADASEQISQNVIENIATNTKESGSTTKYPLSYTFEGKNPVPEKASAEQVSEKLFKPESLMLSPNLNASIATQPDLQDLSIDNKVMEPTVTKESQGLDQPFAKTDINPPYDAKPIKDVYNQKNIDSYTDYCGNEPLKNFTILHKESESIKVQQTKVPENITDQQANAENCDNKHLQDNTIQNNEPEILTREHIMKDPAETTDTAKLYAEESSNIFFGPINKELKSPEAFISNAGENTATNLKDSNYTPHNAFNMVEAKNELQINELEFKTDTDKRQIYDSHKPALDPNFKYFGDEPLKNVTIEIRESLTPDLPEKLTENIMDTDRRQIYDAHKPILDPNVKYEGKELLKNVTIESKENEMAVTPYSEISDRQMFYQPNSQSHSFIQTPFYFHPNDPFSGQWTDMQHAWPNTLSNSVVARHQEYYHMANFESFNRNIPSAYTHENYMFGNQHVDYPVTEMPNYHRTDPFSEQMTNHQHVWPSTLDNKSAESANLEYFRANQPTLEAGNSERHYVPENTEASQSAVETRSIEQLQGALYSSPTKKKYTRVDSPQQQPGFPYQLPECYWKDFPYSQGHMSFQKSAQHYEGKGISSQMQQQEPPDITLHHEREESEGLRPEFSNLEQTQNQQMFSNSLTGNPYLQGQPFVYQQNVTTHHEEDESEGLSSRVCNAYQRPTLPHQISNPWIDHYSYIYENTPLYQQNYSHYEEKKQVSQPEYFKSGQNPQEESMHTNPQVIDDGSMYFTDQYSDVMAPTKQEIKEVAEKNPHYTMVARPVEQIQGALYTAGENKELDSRGLESLELPHEHDPWKNQCLNAENLYGQSPHTYTQQESPKPSTDHNTAYKSNVVEMMDEHGNSPIETWVAKPTSGTYPGMGPQWMLNPNTQNQEAQQHLTQNPYYYHQSFTYYGYPDQQHPNVWINSNPVQTSYEVEIFQPSQDKPESQKRTSDNLAYAEQKTPLQATDIRPDLSKPKGSKSSPPVGPSVAYVSLPQERWRNRTSINLSPKSEPLFENTGTTSPLEEVNPGQKDESVPLSEVLREVRRRTRQEFLAKWALMDVEGKCKRKLPACPPPAPVCPKEDPPPPPPCPPPPPPCPRPCKPRCPPPCMPQRAPCPPKRAPSCPPPRDPICKFESMSLADALYHIFTQLWEFGMTSLVHRLPIFSQRSLPHPEGYTTKAIMTEDVVSQLRLLGDHLCTRYGSDLGEYCWSMETLTLVRGFEPWVPVPSWPFPVKEKEKPFVCPKEGCKQRPPPRYEEPCGKPCVSGNPCLGFPHKFRKSPY